MDWIVLLPPIVAIVLALWTRQVFISLFVGLLIGATILVGGNPLAGVRELLEQMVAVFSDAGNTRIIFFCLLVGGLIALVQASGGVQGFVQWGVSKGWGKTRRGSELLAFLTGLFIFVESSITSLVVGSVGRPFFDSSKLPREKLAYYCDATSAPVCMMIPLNGWGAYILGLLAAQGVSGSEGVSTLVSGLAYNFFAIFAILFALTLAITGWSFGPMKRAEIRARDRGELIRPGSTPMISEEVSEIQPVEGSPRSILDFMLPILSMVFMIFVGLYVTGRESLAGSSEVASFWQTTMKGSGSTSVLWAVGTGIVVAMILYALPKGGKSRVMNIKDSTEVLLKGSAGLVPVTLLIVFAFALGQISRALEMGPYLVGLIGTDAPTWWIPSLLFLSGCFVSFTLGSSWTCFAILIPVAIPLAEGLGISTGLMLGAVLSGGVYGDHASPLSDTSIISSMASACDHVDHVNTQLPYTLLLLGLSLIAYMGVGLLQ